jgi:anti-anti-sigma factor
VHIKHDRLELVGSDGVLAVTGELDAYTGSALASALAEVRSAAGVVCDLARVTFIDSSALRVLVVEHKRLAECGGTLRLQNPSDTVRRLLDVSGLSDLFHVDDAA